MKFRADLLFSAVCAVALMAAGNAFAINRGLSPQDFNKMYFLAQHGKVGILREAVNRGLNIDAVNPNGDTGLCIAAKRKDYVAYNTFRMVGAHPRHQCTYKMYNEYQEFLEEDKAAEAEHIVGNEESLYYKDEERKWWPWLLGGVALGGGIWALTSGGGSKSHNSDPTIIGPENQSGLTGFINKYHKLVDSQTSTNKLNLNGANSNAVAVVDKIKLMPNMLDNADYLQAYIKIINGGIYDNLAGGNIVLGDAAVGLAANGQEASGLNNGTVLINARNGAIGLAASNGAAIYNNPDRNGDVVNGKIDIAFKGGKEGDAVIGMYADTGGAAVNYGQINGTTTKTTVGQDNSGNVGDTITGDGQEGAERVTSANSGSIVGMATFDFYTGTNNSATTVRAENFGDIKLSAGYNAATDVSVNLVGMGSYVDDKFLNGISNPAFAEHMRLDNYGDISLKYDGTYQVSDTALKLGDGGLIGMRADASTQAVNQGNIDIELTSTEMSGNTDVATGMLSVHGAELINGTVAKPYDGSGATGGMLRITNEANSGGVSYGMLAAKGDGTQTRVYKWKAPKVYNYGLIDMLTGNSFAMASFAGGEVVNKGVISLGNIPNDEDGNSYYTENYGLYGAGGADTSEVSLINDGVINIYSKKSTAIYNAFTGSVTLANNGRIFISNKATGSSAMGGNFSWAVNRGVIDYKVGGSENASISGIVSKPGFGTSIPLENWVVSVGETKNEKQLFTNETDGQIIIGGERGSTKDYGGTYVTAGVRVQNQGAASNKGTITLIKYDKDTAQVNAGMWLDDSSTNEAYINNRGNIVVNSTASIGMRNASNNGAEATNYGHILVNGVYGYGMSSIGSGTIFNGRAKNYEEDSTGLLAKTITVNGAGSAGMYINDSGIGYNYGDIVLTGDNTTAVLLDGVDEDSEHFYNFGNIFHTGGKDQNFYWLANGSVREFVYPELVVDGYTLAKLTEGSEARFEGKAEVFGENSHLFVAEDSTIKNGGDISVFGGATAIVAGGKDGTKVNHNKGTISVGDDDSEGIGIKAEKKETSVKLNSLLEVYNGTGVVVTEAASVENLDNVRVYKGVGFDISGKDVDNNASGGKNQGSISVVGEDAIGVRLSNGANFDNLDGNAKIIVSNGGTGVQSGSTWTNNGNIVVSDEGSIGVDVSDYGFTNTGSILINSTGAYAIYNRGGSVGNSKDITGRGVGIMQVSGVTINSGSIDITDGTGVVVQNGTALNESGGEIKVGDGVGMEIAGLLAQGENSGEINVTEGIGVKISQGATTNTGIISVTQGIGMEVLGGVATNEGIIEVVNGYGMYVNGANAKAYNKGGKITLSGSGYGVYVNQGQFTNTGTIEYNSDSGGRCTGGSVSGSGECVNTASSRAASPMYVAKNATFVNRGRVDLGDETVDFDTMREDGGSFVVGEGGTFKADKFRGEVVAGKDVVMHGFEDKYVSKKAFEGENAGLKVTSQSYLFEAETNTHNEAVDVELNRKKFEEVVEEKDLAEFFETNYKLQHNEKMFNVLKSAETAAEFGENKTIESGENFYANLPRENMAVLRGLNAQEQNRILEDGLDGVYAGADYYRTGKEKTGELSGYADDVYSPYAGYGKRLNRNWSVGGTLRAAYADAEYDEAHSSRNNKILLASLPVLYQNGDFKFLTTPSVGVGFGEYERKAISGTYEADTFDVYYGMYNHAEYSVDMKVAELVMEAELNLQGSSMAKAKEDNEGLSLRSNNSLSLESGVGVKLRKRIELAKERSLMLAVGVKYYHEFLDPYKDLSVGMSGSPVNYKINAYDENKDRIRTSAEAVYKDGDFSVAAEVAHNVEKENNVEGGVGVRYNF